ncbi:protoporphyrinogen oxidase [Catellatospora chokoriensis]|uniref:Coproporphyrinogen III oxidase n=1 Tax=Catellatospora chokoriensis TaxID=310353 RepID=A0A8J3NRF3_9ACTN|nr:protoporphyrinogen oxidase [Catellatospora chokoriensis]GIF88070.1 protoporphyrinogen oxidase [Catellatospora chokoriensis]
MRERSEHTVVVGGGIAGLAAALRLSGAGGRVTLVEQSARLGGRISTRPDGVDTGAEQFLMRDPAGGPSGAKRLVDELGLGDRLVHPAIAGAGLWLDGRLRPLPGGTVLGVPGPQAALDGIATLDDHDADRGVPVLPAGEDRSVGALVRERLGGEVVTHLVDPLLGGVYAGSADGLSLAATVPALHRLLGTEHTLRGAVALTTAASRAHQPGSPVFGTLRGGLGTLIAAAAAELARRGVRVLTGVPVRRLERHGAGWVLSVGAAAPDAPESVRAQRIECDAVVLACPARPASRLLHDVSPDAAALVGALDYASVGLVTLELAGVELPALTGFLVPADQGLTIKAATFFSSKWAHHARPDGRVLLRASVGRYGEQAALQRPDAELVRTVLAELGTVLGTTLPAPVAAEVTRWGGGLPQYAPGHVDRVAQARTLLADLPLALAGAAFDGVGIPACVTSAEQAADRILEG